MATNRVKLEDVINEAKTALEATHPDRAIGLCRHVFKFYPRCLEVSRVLGEAYTEKRLLDEADQLFVFVLSADPQDVLGYVDRGFIAYERGKVDEAIMYYERALELDPSIEQLREELLRLYRERSGGRRAKIRLTKVGLANARMRDGFYGQAIEEYAGVLRETPNRLDVQVGLMEAYWRNRDYPRAEKMATDLLNNYANLVKANLVLWHIYGVRRNQDRAAGYLDKAHSLDPLNLIAERLFEDAMVSSDAMRYISMLGVPAVPAPDETSLTQLSGGSVQLVPDWVNTNEDTDVMLGLRVDTPSPLADTPSNLGFDVFALLADTEKHVASQESAGPAVAAPQTKAESEAQANQEALSELDELRNKVSDEPVDTLFNLFEEVETIHPNQIAPLSTPSRPATSGAAFDLDFGSGETDDLSLFEEIEPPSFNQGDSARSAEAGGAPLAQPFRLDLPADEDADSNFAVVPFDLFDDEKPDVLAAEQAREIKSASFGLFEDDLLASEPEPEVEADLVPFGMVEEAALGTADQAPEPEFELPDFGALHQDNEAAQAQVQPFSASSLDVEATPEEDNSYLNYLLEADQPIQSGETADTSLVAPALESDPEENQPEIRLAPHIFHQRNEQGPLPDFVLEASPGSGQYIQPSEIANQPADPFASAYSKPDNGLSEDEASVATAVPEQATDLTPGALPQQPQQYQEQENVAMPIKRGPEDDSNVFDWEREELPDYLQAFAMDEDEVALSGMAAPNPMITDVNTPPARIRARDDTGAPGDLPEWLNPVGGAPGGKPVRGEQVDLGGSTRPGSGGSLPGWLNEAELDSASGAGANTGIPGFDGPDMGGLQPFNLGEDGFGGPPTPPPPAPRNLMPDLPPPAGRPSPNPPGPAFGGLDDLAPFSFDDGGTGYEAPAPPPTPPARGGFGGGFEQPAPPPARGGFGGGFEPPAAPPARGGFGGSFEPPAAPPASGGFGLPGMDDLMPFSFDDEVGGAMTPPPPQRSAPPPAAPPPRPAPPQPPVSPMNYAPPSPKPSFLGDEDMGDLMPFSFGDEGGSPTPPPPTRQAPPPSAPARPSMPARPFDPGVDLSGFEEADLGSISPFSLGGDTPTVAPPSRPTSPFGAPSDLNGSRSPGRGATPPPPAGDDFDFEPFSLGGDIPGIFENNPANPRGGTSRLGLDAINPLDSLSEQPFNQGRRGRQAEPEMEAEPGQEAPLREYDWIKERKKREQERKATEAAGNDSLFQKLASRRRQQEADRAKQPPEPIVPPPVSRPGDFEEILSFEEINRRAARPQTDRLTPPSVQPTAQSGRDMMAEAFDLSDLGLNDELADEAFNQSLEETLPTPPQTTEPMADFTNNVPPLQAGQAFDFEPFDLQGIGQEVERSPEEDIYLEPVAPEPALPFTLPEPFSAQTDDLEMPIFDFDLTEEPAAAQAPVDALRLPTWDEPVADKGPEVFDLGAIAPEPAAKPPEKPFATDDFDLFASEVNEPPVSTPPPVMQESAIFELEKPESLFNGLPEEPPGKPTFDFGPAETPSFELPVEQEPIKPLFQTPVEPVKPLPVEPVPSVRQAPIRPEPAYTSPSVTAPTNGNAAQKPAVAARSGTTDSLQRFNQPSRDLDTNLQLAGNFYNQQEYTQSISHFNAAIKQADASTFDKIVGLLTQILAKPEADRRYHRLLGDVYKKQGQYQAALSEYSKALGPVGAKR